MKISLESTTKIVHLAADRGGPSIEARVWEGVTETGIPVHCFITRLAATIPREDPRQSEFAAQLTECKAPTPDVEAYPLRMIL